MDRLANEDHIHIATEDELNVYRGNWWIRSNFVGSDTMPIRDRADFKEALSTLRRLKNEDDQAFPAIRSHHEFQRSRLETHVRYHCEIGGRTRRD